MELGATYWEWARYRQLAKEYHENGFQSVPDSTVAWLEVDGTTIDLPIAGRSSDSSWFLTHNVWGQDSEIGCPYLDERCSPTSPVVIVYGHNIFGTSLMFSQLATLSSDHGGPAGLLGKITTKSGETRAFYFACLLSFEDNFSPLINDLPKTEGDRLDWTTDLIEASSDLSSEALSLLPNTTQTLILVTCSSPFMSLNGDARTAVVFVR